MRTLKLYFVHIKNNRVRTDKYRKDTAIFQSVRATVMESEHQKNKVDLDSTDEKFLKTLYYNLKQPTAYGSENLLWKNIKQAGKSITRKQLQEWLSQQDVYTTHHSVIR